MKLAWRIVVTLVALLGAVGWSLLFIRLLRWAAGMPQGTETAGSHPPTVSDRLFVTDIWLLPLMPLVFVVLWTCGLFKGRPRIIFFYTLVILVAGAVLLLWFSRPP